MGLHHSRGCAVRTPEKTVPIVKGCAGAARHQIAEKSGPIPIFPAYPYSIPSEFSNVDPYKTVPARVGNRKVH